MYELGLPQAEAKVREVPMAATDERMRDTYRRWGYLQADLDKFGRIPPFSHRELDGYKGAKAEQWRKTYCGKIGAEFMHMALPERCDWIAERMEGALPELDRAFILKRIVAAETFERFLHTRYVGVIRFSLDGLAAAIPFLDVILERAADLGYEVAMLCMAHRGRLNVMHHIAMTPMEYIIAAFEDVDPKSALGSDDVKYHKGAVGTYRTRKGKTIAVELASNPSHLESVNPVLMGKMKARQERLNDKNGAKVLGIMIHGDAAFAGQGLVAETLNYANMPGFSVGGVIHVIFNNLIGFTTSPAALHSSRYASDLAKRLDIPILHVNAESPDHVVHSGLMAMDYKKAFSSDVVVDLIGYRRYGHNESDDPTVTSPALYELINKTPLLGTAYGKQLGVGEGDLKKLEDEQSTGLSEGLEKGRAMTKKPAFETLPDYWSAYSGDYYDPALEVETGVSAARLAKLAQAITKFPAGFTVHPKLGKVFEQRAEMGEGKRPVDWGSAEALAMASLLDEGYPVRVVGQDAGRGTFSHRHAIVYDHKSGAPYIPLANVGAKQAPFAIYDSVLSEAAAVGFEYGYTWDAPEALVCWEAQFGDFVNGAQILIDQYIAAGEDKWHLLSGLVMLLPHGYEGRGPEHSSARLERFLQLAAEDNIQVCQPSTAAQNFHMLRRQVMRKWRKPLVVMTPKSMLRAQPAASQLELFTSGTFKNVLEDTEYFPEARRVLLCSGKIVHDLRAKRKERGDTDTAVITVEQLYPFPEQELVAELARYPQANVLVWVQEEAANMGALSYIRPLLERIAAGRPVKAVRRSASASPASGSGKAHQLEQDALLNLAFTTYE